MLPITPWDKLQVPSFERRCKFTKLFWYEQGRQGSFLMGRWRRWGKSGGREMTRGLNLSGGWNMSGWREMTGWRSPPVYRDFRPPITGEPKGVGTSSAGEGVQITHRMEYYSLLTPNYSLLTPHFFAPPHQQSWSPPPSVPPLSGDGNPYKQGESAVRSNFRAISWKKSLRPLRLCVKYLTIAVR